MKGLGIFRREEDKFQYTVSTLYNSLESQWMAIAMPDPGLGSGVFCVVGLLNETFRANMIPNRHSNAFVQVTPSSYWRCVTRSPR